MLHCIVYLINNYVKKRKKEKKEEKRKEKEIKERKEKKRKFVLQCMLHCIVYL